MNNFEKWLTYEDREHIKVVNWLKTNLPEVISFHVPNESKKSPFERYKASIMGILKGCPDFIILHPKHSETREDGNGNKYKILEHNGLMIELKAPEHNRVVLKGKNEGKIVKAKGKLSPEQIEILERLNRLKYLAVACFGADEAISEIKKYFSVK
jgi:hypothetical protein